MKSRQHFLAYGLLAVVAACGGDDDDDSAGGKGVDTGLPATEELSSLSDDDTAQVCTKTAMALNNLLPKSELKSIACVGTALDTIAESANGELDSSDIPMCKELSSKCVSSEEFDDKDLVIEVVDETDCKTTTTRAAFGDCKATVSDYERCLGRIMTELRTRFRSLTCDALSDLDQVDENLNGKIDVSKAPECQGLRTKCPDVNLSLAAAPN